MHNSLDLSPDGTHLNAITATQRTLFMIFALCAQLGDSDAATEAAQIVGRHCHIESGSLLGLSLGYTSYG